MLSTMDSVNEQLRTAHPLTRFRELYGALLIEDPRPLDGAWLRFAAGMILVNSHDPERLAHELAESGKRIGQRVRWYQPLASPLRHLVAAVAVQTGIEVDELVDRIERRRGEIARAGLARGAPALVTALVLEVGGVADDDAVSRLGDIVARMRQRHWWLTNRRQLPACAMLATLPLTADEAVRRSDDCYATLHASGLLAGRHLLVAAEILPLADVPTATACARHLALASAFQQRFLPLWHGAYDALATLALLDHDADLVAGRFGATLEELERIGAATRGTAGYAVAAELTFLDLVRYDRVQGPLASDVDGGALLIDRIHRHRIAGIVLAYASMASPEIATETFPLHYPLP